LFVLAIIAFIVAFFAIMAGVLSDEKDAPYAAGGVALFTGAVFTLISCLSTVPTRNVGIVTQWGKPTGRTTGAGLQWTAPWQDVDDWDASGQTYAHLGDQCVWVTVKGPRDMCVPVQIEWAALPENAPANWAAFREADGMDRFGTWVARRVDPQMTAALMETFAGYDPFASIDPKTGDVAVPNLNETYRKPLSDAIAQSLGHDITVKSIAFGKPGYDKATTDALGEYSSKALAGRNLDLDKANAVKRKAVTDIDASVNQTARCLSIAEKNNKEPGLCMSGGTGVTLTHSTN